MSWSRLPARPPRAHNGSPSLYSWLWLRGLPFARARASAASAVGRDITRAQEAARAPCAFVSFGIRGATKTRVSLHPEARNKTVVVPPARASRVTQTIVSRVSYTSLQQPTTPNPNDRLQGCSHQATKYTCGCQHVVNTCGGAVPGQHLRITPKEYAKLVHLLWAIVISGTCSPAPAVSHAP